MAEGLFLNPQASFFEPQTRPVCVCVLRCSVFTGEVCVLSGEYLDSPKGYVRKAAQTGHLVEYSSRFILLLDIREPDGGS